MRDGSGDGASCTVGNVVPPNGAYPCPAPCFCESTWELSQVKSLDGLVYSEKYDLKLHMLPAQDCCIYGYFARLRSRGWGTPDQDSSVRVGASISGVLMLEALENVTASQPPYFNFHGSCDTVISYDSTRRMIEAMNSRAKGIVRGPIWRQMRESRRCWGFWPSTLTWRMPSVPESRIFEFLGIESIRICFLDINRRLSRPFQRHPRRHSQSSGSRGPAAPAAGIFH